MDIGDTVLVVPSIGENFATPVKGAEIGDTVILYNLKDNTRIAVPTLTFDLGSTCWVSPSFDFAGFNFSLDFNMNLLSLDLELFLPPWILHKFAMKVTTVYPSPPGTWWVYGDSPKYGSGLPGCKVVAGGSHGGDLTIQLEDAGLLPYDMNMEIKFLEGNQIELWVYKDHIPYYIDEMYFDGNYLCKCGDETGKVGGPFDQTYHGYFYL